VDQVASIGVVTIFEPLVAARWASATDADAVNRRCLDSRCRRTGDEVEAVGHADDCDYAD
jgi:hypothetical protein